MGAVLTVSGILASGFSGDIVTDGQKNMNNWTVDGDVTIAYADGENEVAYENTYSIATTEEELNQILSDNTGYPTRYSSGVGRNMIDDLSYGVPYGFVFFNLGNTSGSMPNNVFLLHLQGAVKTNGVDISKITVTKLTNQQIQIQNNLDYTVNVIGIKLYLYNGNYDWAQSYGSWEAISAHSSRTYNLGYNINDFKVFSDTIGNPITGYAELSLPVVDGKQYAFQFSGCSPTGFDADTDNIIITSGSNSVTATFDNTQTETLKEYTIYFTADGDTASVKFDFSKIVNSSNIELTISDISLYELG